MMDISIIEALKKAAESPMAHYVHFYDLIPPESGSAREWSKLTLITPSATIAEICDDWIKMREALNLWSSSFYSDGETLEKQKAKELAFNKFVELYKSLNKGKI